MIPIKDIIPDNQTAASLINQLYESGGFSAKKLGQGLSILENMCKDQDCTKILSFPACIISTGTRGVIKELVKRKLVDVIITTCGTLDHDFARVYENYLHGSFEADDSELREKEINRLGNIFIPNSAYGKILEDKLQPILKQLYESDKKELSSKELCWELGKTLDESSILYWAWKNKIPIFVDSICSTS